MPTWQQLAAVVPPRDGIIFSDLPPTGPTTLAIPSSAAQWQGLFDLLHLIYLRRPHAAAGPHPNSRAHFVYGTVLSLQKLQ